MGPHVSAMGSCVEQMSPDEFQRRFGTDEACEEHLSELRWPLGFLCPRCRHGGYYWLESRKVYQCALCRHQLSLTSGTVMHSSKVPLRKWFRAIYLLVTGPSGCSARSLAAELEVSYSTAWLLLHRIRAAMAAHDSHCHLVGEVERGGFLLPDASGAVEVTIAMEAGREHGHVRMSPADPVAGTTASLPDETAEPEPPGPLCSLVSEVRAIIKATYRNSGIRHTRAYLAELCYRFNSRGDGKALFDRLARSCLVCQHLSRSALAATFCW